MRAGDVLFLFDDGSREDMLELATPEDMFWKCPNIGTEAQRREHLGLFINRPDYTHLYLTDPDALHDPSALTELLRLQEKYGGAPICGYDTMAHVRLPNNTIEDDPSSEVIWRRVAPGISYLLTREHMERLAPCVDQMTAFDWQIPALLGNRFAVTRRSVVDHIGVGGLRHPEGEGLDGGDRARNPTDWLVAKRAEVVDKLKGQHAPHNA